MQACVLNAKLPDIFKGYTSDSYQEKHFEYDFVMKWEIIYRAQYLCKCAVQCLPNVSLIVYNALSNALTTSYIAHMTQMEYLIIYF